MTTATTTGEYVAIDTIARRTSTLVYRNARENLLKSECHTLINTVNCVGVMGAGIALQFRQRFPKIVPGYRDYCLAGGLHPGQLFRSRKYLPAHTIVSMATKDDWRDPSRIEWVRDGLATLVEKWEEWELGPSIALPPLGCGLGTLSWGEVGPLMAYYLGSLPESAYVEIYISPRYTQYHPIYDADGRIIEIGKRLPPDQIPDDAS